MLFRFKSTLTDFLVDEQLPYKLLSEGTHFFVHIEKQATTTMEVIDHLRRTLALPKNLIGYAGLKDKKGITRQRLSFDAEAMKNRMQVKYREDILLKSLKEVCHILETGRHTKQLSLRDDFHNHFSVILRATKKLSLNEKELTKITLDKLLASPIPNYFGTQRFGINGRNVKEAEAMLQGKRGDIIGFDRKFKLQALASHLFNMTLKTRIEKNPTGLMDGDFLEIEKKLYIYHNGNLYLQTIPGKQEQEKQFFVQAQIEKDSKPFAKDMSYAIMLPHLGYNSLIPAQTTDMGRYYHLFMRRQYINEESWKLFQELEIFGIMRAVWIRCMKPKRTRL
jgi:tRNA(Glu) U13 pseudouridine synthase TruD